jgi:hypothetical protein
MRPRTPNEEIGGESDLSTKALWKGFGMLMQAKRADLQFTDRCERMTRFLQLSFIWI